MMSRSPGEKLKKKSYFFFLFIYCPLQILALKTCSQNISKTITASSIKLCQLIEDNEENYLVKISKNTLFYFFELPPFANLSIGKLLSRYLKKYYS